MNKNYVAHYYDWEDNLVATEMFFTGSKMTEQEVYQFFKGFYYNCYYFTVQVMYQ